MKRIFAIAFAVALAAGCDVDTVPQGLRKTPEGNGPVVKFDTAHRPIPEIPLPNDVATFADPSSRTGRRLNASLVAPTEQERRTRADLALLEGWGTMAPVTVAFERPDGVAETEAAIDLDDIADRMIGD